MSDNLEFYPLYVIYHDQWGFRDWNFYNQGGWIPSNQRPHRGHCHFFMLGHEPELDGASRAFSGSQSYNFSIEDEWSIRSKDPNKTDNVVILGTPKWYFYIEEYWRRVYIQPWDSRKNKYINGDIGKTGIKYDASSNAHTFGPFRECKGNFFFFNNMARTISIEYYSNELKTERDHYLKGGNNKWNIDDFTKNGDTDFIIPRNFWCGGDNGLIDGPIDEIKGRDFGYQDSYYIYPTIEYQVVNHLNWERLYGWQDRDIDENIFGDGLEVQVSIPYKIDGKIQSPFSDDDGNVYPVGSYFHNFEENNPDRVLKYPTIDEVDSLTYETLITEDSNEVKSIILVDVELTIVNWGDGSSENITTSGEIEHIYSEPGTYSVSILKKDTNPVNDKWRIPDELKGQKVVWSIPSNISSKLDGMWVEQCLGGIVRAKALVTIQDNFGGKKEVWITANNFIVNENFSGIDQGEPLNENS
ncbi:MAG: hypothetical protein M0P71_01325 [Melioribacteraceae bacterium]|nr:hypothetical protein [Melioribacteraceae bacterium]